MKQNDIYEIIEMECRKQLLHGEVKGTTAKFIADKLCMQRSNVFRELKRLIEIQLIYKSSGRPVFYYVDPNYIDLSKDTLNDKYILSNYIDDYLKNNKLKLMALGFSKEESKQKLIDEIGQYVTKYFDSLNNSNKSEVANVKVNRNGENMKYILGVDGGGTKTETIAYSLDGKELARGNSGFGNIIVNKEIALKNLELSILECTKKLRIEDCAYLCLGLAGCEAGDNKIIIERYLKSRFNCPIKIMNDAQIALRAILKGNDGILTIADTGSITIGKYNDLEVRVGGWGHLVGDEGSGYFIAMEAIRRVFLENDLELSEGTLTKEIYRVLNCNDTKQLLDLIYKSNKGEIAALVPTIDKMAKKGDNISVEILKKAGRDLAQNTIRAIKQMKVKGKIKVGINGSILTKIQIIKDSFINELILNNIGFELYDEDISPTKGAYYEVIKEIQDNM